MCTRARLAWEDFFELLRRRPRHRSDVKRRRFVEMRLRKDIRRVPRKFLFEMESETDVGSVLLLQVRDRAQGDDGALSFFLSVVCTSSPLSSGWHKMVRSMKDAVISPADLNSPIWSAKIKRRRVV